jgi:hypothetical protein
MTDVPETLDALLRQLDEKKVEIDLLTKQINSMVKGEIEKSKLHSKRVMKQGMESFFSGSIRNPYPMGSDDAELWDYGFNLSKDNWSENKK